MDVFGGGSVVAPATSQFIPVLLRDSSDNSELISVAHSQVTAHYWRQNEAPVAITLSAGGSIPASYASGAWREVNSSTHPGLYHLGVPNAAFASGAANWVIITVKHASSYLFTAKYDLVSVSNQDLSSYFISILDELTDSNYGLAHLVRSATPGNALAVGSDGAAQANVVKHLGSVPAILNGGFYRANVQTMESAVVSEIQDALGAELDEAIPELTTGAPTATPSVRTALMLLYMAIRNKLESTSTDMKIHDDAGNAICKATLSDDDTTFVRSELVTGP